MFTFLMCVASFFVGAVVGPAGLKATYSKLKEWALLLISKFKKNGED